jgi:hypothetical protein
VVTKLASSFAAIGVEVGVANCQAPPRAAAGSKEGRDNPGKFVPSKASG